jgi:High potential iron-sulfur protein
MSESELSRRSMLQHLATAAGTVTVLTVGAHQAQAQTKVSKTVVGYQDQPKGNQKCDNCINFQPPSACKVVEGDITSEGWCKAYAPKG